MVIAEKLLYFLLDLILPVCIGYLLKKQNKLGEIFFDRMIKAGIIVVVPVMVIVSFWGNGISLGMLWLPILGVMMQVLSLGAGFILAGKKFRSPLEKGSYLLAAMLTNRGTIGTLSVYILYGERGYAYAQLVLLLGTVVVYSFCFPMARYYRELENGGERSRPSLRSVLFNVTQLPLLGIITGIILYFSGLKRPEVLENVFNVLIYLSAWLLLIPVGHSMDFSKIKNYWKSTFDILGIKFILTPLILYLPAKLLLSDETAVYTVLVLSAAPTAINAVITAKLNKLNVHVAMAAFILTTTVYILFVFPGILLLNTL